MPGPGPSESLREAEGSRPGALSGARDPVGTAWTRCRAVPTGFTLVELLIVIAVLAVLSGAAISLLSGGTSETALEEGLRRVAADLAYARAAAVASGSSRSVAFDPGDETYLLLDGITPLTHPLTKSDYLVDLDDEFRGAGLDIVSCDFAGQDTLRFLGGGLVQSGGRLIMACGQARGEVKVSTETGRISWRMQ